MSSGSAANNEILNLEVKDPFLDANKGGASGSQSSVIHIRIQQRNGRKTLTTVQGISEDFDKKKMVKIIKKKFACNGTVVNHPEWGEVLQVQGDQRTNIAGFLLDVGLAKKNQLKIHGF
jgi:translation initiation factor 1